MAGICPCATCYTVAPKSAAAAAWPKMNATTTTTITTTATTTVRKKKAERFFAARLRRTASVQSFASDMMGLCSAAQPMPESSGTRY